MVKISRRNKIILNYIVGPLLFAVFAIGIYQRIRSQPNLQQSWSILRASLSGDERWKFYLVMALALLNWGIETRKWQLLVRPIERVSYFRAFKGVLSGLSLSLFLPNRVGEYFGRMAFMHEGNRLRSIALSILGSLSQLIITLLGGLVALFLLKDFILNKQNTWLGLQQFWIDVILVAVAVGVFLLLVVYYRAGTLAYWFERTRLGGKIRFFIEHVEDFRFSMLTRILSLSFFRYCVFVVQYVLLMDVFDAGIAWTTVAGLTSVMFLILTIIPTLPVAEVALRGEASIQLFGLASSNTLGIVATAGGIWLINLIIPAIAGSLFILSIKLFRK